jgi:hypothetical protein
MSSEGAVRSRMIFSSGWSAVPLVVGCGVLAGCVVAPPPPTMPVNLAPPTATYSNYGHGAYPVPLAAPLPGEPPPGGPLSGATPSDAGPAYAAPPPPPVAETPLDQSAGGTPVMPDTPSIDQPGQNLLATPDTTAPGDTTYNNAGSNNAGSGTAAGSDAASSDADTAQRLQAIRDRLAHDQAAAPPTRYGGMSSAGDVAPLPPRSRPLLSP